MSRLPTEPDTDVELVYESIKRDIFWRNLRANHNPFVAGEGAATARVMIVGEAPGAQEAARGRPFVGSSGLVLRHTLMDAAGLSLHNTWITNVLKYRPPSNRTPNDGEIAHARKALAAEWIAVGKPRVIVAVGGTAFFALLGKRISILREAGRPYTGQSLVGPNVTLWPMIHPAFGLRQPAVQEDMERHWADLGAWWHKEVTRHARDEDRSDNGSAA